MTSTHAEIPLSVPDWAGSCRERIGGFRFTVVPLEMVGGPRLELGTNGLKGRCSTIELAAHFRMCDKEGHDLQ